jgi:hypothetical protein
MNGHRGGRSADARPLWLGVEHLAFRSLRELLHLDLQIIHEGLDLRGLGTEIRGCDLKSCDTVGAVGEELAAVKSFQIGDPLADVGGEVGAGGFEDVKSRRSEQWRRAGSKDAKSDTNCEQWGIPYSGRRRKAGIFD